MEARWAWIRRRWRYRPLNPGVRMHERACVDGCRPSGSSGNGYQPEDARLPGIAPNDAAWSAPAVLGRCRKRRERDAGFERLLSSGRIPNQESPIQAQDVMQMIQIGPRHRTTWQTHGEEKDEER